jgi:hypothetical protein
MSFTSDFDRPPHVSPLQAASRFDTFFDLYGLSLKQQADLEQRTITMIARSPASPCAQALAINLGRFEPLSVEVNIIFAQIAPAETLNFVLQALGTACRRAPDTIIRWAKNRALLDAHERLTLGRTLCWTGDSMRRTEDARSAIDCAEDCTPAILAEANASFAAVWAASKPLPRTLFSQAGLMNLDRAVRAPAPPSPGFSAELNIVRIDNYLRSRRH